MRYMINTRYKNNMTLNVKYKMKTFDTTKAQLLEKPPTEEINKVIKSE